MHQMLELAGRVARPTDAYDPRNFWLGCVGIRKDGVIVSAKNSPVYSTQVENYQLLPTAHAEGRVLRKLGRGGELYVARIAKSTGGFAMSRPCGMCQVRIKSFNVKRVHYTLNETQFGIWYPETDIDKVYKL